MITPVAIKEALDAVDIEDLLKLGAPADEYETEARAIVTALRGSKESELTEDKLTAVVCKVWLQMFGPFSEEAITKRQNAFRQVARRILAPLRRLHQPAKPVVRTLTPQEIGWINEILTANPDWSDVDVGELETEAECTCGCNSVVLKLPATPHNPRAAGKAGAIGELRHDSNGKTVRLYALDGSLSVIEVTRS